jgi:RNA polymerase sigma-70 factor (ECF subfamily)
MDVKLVRGNDRPGQDERTARFEALAPALIEPLRRFLVRRTDPATAEDALSETLLVCWRRWDDAPAQLLPWAYGVARNCLANAERARRRQDRLAAKIAIVDPPRDHIPEVDTPDVLAALNRLRPQDAELLRLWAWEDLKPAEIGQVLGMSANAATIRLHRAREKLRTHLRETGVKGHKGSERRRRP